MTEQKNNPAAVPADREIIISRVVNAPRELVWEAMTDPLHVVNWWGPRGFSTTIETMDVRPGGIWRHVMRGPDGTEYPNESVFQEVVKPERIVWLHGGTAKKTSISFVMTWTFEEVEPGKTKVTIHQVYPTAEMRNKVATEFGAIEGGKQTLERLSEHVPNVGKTSEYLIVRSFDAPPELVWKAWTEPKRLAQWWGPRVMKTPVCEMDVRPGGKYRFVMRAPDGKDYPVKGVYREVVPPSRLVFTMDCSEHAPEWHDLVDPKRGSNPNPAGEMLATVTFEKVGERTRQTVRMQLKSAAIRSNMVRMGMNEGWSESLDRLAELLANK